MSVPARCGRCGRGRLSTRCGRARRWRPHSHTAEHVAVLQSLNAACSTIGVYISLGVCGGEALAEFGDGGFQSGLVAQHADAMPHGVLDAGTIPHLVGGGIVSSSRSGRGGQRDRRMVEHGTGGGVQERFGCPGRVVTVRDGGQTGAASVDEPLEQRVGGKTVGAHDTGTSAFAGRIQAGNGGPGVQTRCECLPCSSARRAPPESAPCSSRSRSERV